MRKRSHSLLLLKIISPHYLPAGIPVKILKIRTKNVLAIKIFSVGLTYIIGYLPMALYYCITSFRFLTAEVRLSKMSCFSESKKKFFFFQYFVDRNGPLDEIEMNSDEDFLTISSEVDFGVATASFFMRRLAELIHPEMVIHNGL